MHNIPYRSLCHELHFPCLLTFSLLPACVIDHSPYIVDFRSAGWLPYVFKYRHALRAKYFGSRVFFSLWRPVWTASAQDHWQIRCSAPNKGGGRHHRKRASALTSLRRSIRRCNFSFNKKISRIGQTTVCQFISPSVLVCLGFFFRWRSIVRICTCMDMCVVS